MIARASAAARLRRVAPLAGLVAIASASCAPHRAACDATCGDPQYACVAGECLRDGRKLEVGALDKFGQLQSRRLLVEPEAIALVAPGDRDGARGAFPTVGVLGRSADARALLFLRFAVDLPPGTTVVEARLLLDRAPAVDADPAPIVVHAARIVDPWDARSISWARQPRIEEIDAPRTTVPAARRTVAIDVRSLVRRWRLHGADDQGIALVVDHATPSGMAFALADGSGSSDDAAPVPPIHAPGPPPLFAASESAGSTEASSPRGPRLELYVKP